MKRCKATETCGAVGPTPDGLYHRCDKRGIHEWHVCPCGAHWQGADVFVQLKETV